MIPLTDRYQPKRLSEFVGLDRPKAILGKFAANPYPSAWLLLGPSGLGKTSAALALAAEIGAEVHHIASKTCDMAAVDAVCHKCHYIPMSPNHFHMVIVDESDQMSSAAQLAFLSKLDGTAPVPDTVFLFTANDTSLLKDRFLSRCRLVKFTTDGLESAGISFLREIYLKEAPAGQAEPDYAAILKQSDLNIRAALMALEVEILCPSEIVPITPAGPANIKNGCIRPAGMPDSRLSAPEVADRLGIYIATLYAWVKQNKIPKPDGRPMSWDRAIIEPYLVRHAA
jgi:replication-associated recombination protein RarA/predicted DNA-binding transcriptional regulator AlpA